MTTPQPPTTPAPAVPDALVLQQALDLVHRELEDFFASYLTQSELALICKALELCTEEVRLAEQRGADAELEACFAWLEERGLFANAKLLRAARRPSPPTLRERALAVLSKEEEPDGAHLTLEDVALIREALQQEGADG